MPFCKSCGSAVDGQFCPKCGTPVAAPVAPGYNAAPPPPPQPQYAQPSAPGAVPPPPPPAAAAGGMTDNVAGLLCYILGLITGILFLVLEPYNRNPFVRFHAFQSVFYGVSAIGLMIVLAILGIIVTSILPFGLAMLWHMLTMLIWLGYFVGWIILMVKAYGGQRFKLPLIGDLAEKQAAK